MSVITTSTLSGELMTYLERKFLARAMYQLVYKEGAVTQTQVAGNGASITFNRYAPLSTAVTPLTQGSNPSDAAITAAQVSVTLAEYGNTLRMSKFLSLTSIDKGNKEKIELLGQNMGETLDELVRAELFSGATVQYANSRASLITVAVGDVFNATEVKKAVRTLEAAKAMPYSDGMFIGKVQPVTKYDLISDTVWVNAKTYSDVKKLYQGEMGELYQVRFLLSKNGKVETGAGAGGTNVYSNFVHGDQSFGVYDLEGDLPQLVIKISGPQDTSNPANRFSTASWVGSFATKTLNANWIVNVKSGATP
jgi:N4-gp56 family major capsid protein